MKYTTSAPHEPGFYFVKFKVDLHPFPIEVRIIKEANDSYIQYISFYSKGWTDIKNIKRNATFYGPIDIPQ